MTEFPETRSSLLVQVASAENREAWEQFVLIYRPLIYRMARRRGLQDADAQDLSQSVLVRISSAIGKWEKDEANTRFRHWLRRVARNAIFTALSRSPKDAAWGGTDMQDLLDNQPDISAEVEQEIDHEYMRELYLRAAMAVKTDVNADTWRTFELSVVEGKSSEEVAALIGKSVGVVYAVRSRVMQRLREQIQRLEDREK